MIGVTKNERGEWKSTLSIGSKLCIVMEYGPKGTVHHLIQAQKPRPLDEATVWKLMLQSTLGRGAVYDTQTAN